jgi:hypothetical protein
MPKLKLLGGMMLAPSQKRPYLLESYIRLCHGLKTLIVFLFDKTSSILLVGLFLVYGTGSGAKTKFSLGFFGVLQVPA